MLEAALKPEELDVRRWHELSDFYDKTVELYEWQFGVLRLIVLAMDLLSVLKEREHGASSSASANSAPCAPSAIAGATASVSW
jgi:hypothetical protein